VLVVWLCFLARGAFYSFLLPIWEGQDEWAHVAYVQLIAAGEGLPRPGHTRVSLEIEESLKLAPLAYGTVSLPAPRATHGGFWRLPEEQRNERRRRLADLPPQWARVQAEAGELSYEAQQPPLYYCLLTPVQVVASGASLQTRVLLMRLASLLVASLAIPLGWAAARLVLGSGMLAAGVVAVAAAMPGFAMSAVRVANDGLSTVLYTALLCVVLSADGVAGWRRTLLTGAILGAGLLTKAYFLTALPALAIVHGWRLWRGRGGRARIAIEFGVTMLIAGLIAGWWYWRNFALTGSMSGLQQVVALGDRPLFDILGGAPRVNWLRFIDSAFFSHVWMGNWSFLQVRSWMYRLFGGIVLGAAVGLLALAARRKRAGLVSSTHVLLAPAALYGCFWCGLAYHELTFSLHGLSSGGGWYLYAVVIPEVLLTALGLMALAPVGGRPWVLASSAGLFALLDLYAAHFLLVPYYTGMIAHRTTGGLESFHLSQFGAGGLQTVIGRFGGETLSGATVIVLWLFYLAGTIALPLAAARAARVKLS
jgi:hypothetical protein